jgi:hypothetical protein
VYIQPIPTIGEAPPKPPGAFERVIVRANGDLPPEEGQRKFISSKHFDIAPFKMGYVNSKKGAFYCSRMPSRVQKQGLCGESFKALTNGGATVPFHAFLNCPEVPAMVAGRYPSFDQAVRALEKCPAVAFHREFCLMKDEVIPDLVFLYHKGTKAGMHSKGEITLGVKYKCLKEALEEMKLRVGAF